MWWYLNITKHIKHHLLVIRLPHLCIPQALEDLPGARKAYAEALRLTQKLPEGKANALRRVNQDQALVSMFNTSQHWLITSLRIRLFSCLTLVSWSFLKKTHHHWMSFDVNGSLMIYIYIYIIYIHIKLYWIILYYINIWMFPSLGECRFPQIWPWKLRCLCADQCSCWDPKSQRAQLVVTKMAGSGWNWWLFIPPKYRGHVSQAYFGLETKKHALFRNLLDIHIHIYIYVSIFDPCPHVSQACMFQKLMDIMICLLQPAAAEHRNLALVCLRLDPSQPMRALELCEAMWLS